MKKNTNWNEQSGLNINLLMICTKYNDQQITLACEKEKDHLLCAFVVDTHTPIEKILISKNDYFFDKNDYFLKNWEDTIFLNIFHSVPCDNHI